MLMQTRAELEPLARLRAILPEDCLSTFELLAGTFDMPPDQPTCATAIAAMANSFVLYAGGIRHARSEFKTLVQHARTIQDAVSAHAVDIQGLAPAGQLNGRVSQYPAWALLTQLGDEQIPSRVALGAEIAIALLERSQLSKRYCEQLRRDAGKYGRPPEGEERELEDLADLKFGRHWLAHFHKVDRQVRRRVELPDPHGPLRPEHTDPKHRLDILARLRWRFEYPAPKHRQAAIDDSHLPREQLRRAALAVRGRVQLGDPAAIIQSICLISRITPDLASSLPLITGDTPIQILGLDIERGTLVLDLRVLFPNRKSPPVATTSLFHQSLDFLVIPLPVFLARSLRDQLSRNPGAHLLGDLLGWVRVDHRASLVSGEACKLSASLARAARTTGALAIMAGVDRLTAACIEGVTFAFVCVDKGSARGEIFQTLIQSGIPFIDVGMGPSLSKEGPIKEMLRTTYYPREKATDVLASGHAEIQDAPEDIYRTNIQISELNALNASIAVVRFKQLRGFYIDDVQGNNLLFDIRDLKIASDA